MNLSIKNFVTFLILSIIGLAEQSYAQTSLPVPDHIVIVVLENHAYQQLIGSKEAPYINQLASTGALFTQSYALTHPSQPNYIMMFSGGNQGVKDDNIPAGAPFKTPNLGASLISKGLSFTGYSEDLPSIGYTGANSGAYYRKHAPWVHWQGSGSNGLAPAVNRPLTSFPKNNYSALPTISFVIPNQNNDIHDGTINMADNWIKNNLDGYVQWAKSNNSLLIVTFDEDDNNNNNQIMTFFVGPMVKQGKYSSHINHYNVLRTLEDMYGLNYAGASSTVNPITDCWNLNKTAPESPTGIGSDGSKSEKPLSVFPNPVTDNNIHINLNNNFLGNVNLLLFDIQGKKVKDLKIEKVSSEMDLPLEVPEMAKGTYILEVLYGERREVQKVVKY